MLFFYIAFLLFQKTNFSLEETKFLLIFKGTCIFKKCLILDSFIGTLKHPFLKFQFTVSMLSSFMKGLNI